MVQHDQETPGEVGGEGRAGADDPLVRTQLEGEESDQLDHVQGDHSCSPADEMRSTLYFVSIKLASSAVQISEPIKCEHRC